MTFKWVSKDPDETVDYSMDWSRYLNDQATIDTVTWFVNNESDVKTQFNIGSIINNLQTENGLNETSSVGDYWVSFMSRFISESARQFNYIIQPDALRKIAYRWAFKSLAPSKRPPEYGSSALIKKRSDNKVIIQRF